MSGREGERVDRDKLVSEDKVRVGASLIEAGRVLRRHAVGLTVLGLLVLLPLELIGAALTRGNPDVPRTGAPVGTDVVSGLIKLEPILGDALVFLIGVPLVAGTVVLLAAGAQAERTLDVPAAVRGAARRTPWLLTATLLVAIGIGLAALLAALLDLVIPPVLPSGSIADVVASIILLSGLVALIPVVVVAYPAAVLQRSSVGGTARSVLALARSDFVLLLGRGLAVIAIASMLGALARFVVMLVVGLVGSGPFANAIGEAVADLVFIPAFAAGATLVYLDTRGRRGEIDRERLVQEVEAAGG